VVLSLNFLFAVEETLFYGAKGITASMDISGRHQRLYGLMYMLYCRQKVVKGAVSVFLRKDP
jgi:hypothetical protein